MRGVGKAPWTAGAAAPCRDGSGLCDVNRAEGRQTPSCGPDHSAAASRVLGRIDRSFFSSAAIRNASSSA